MYISWDILYKERELLTISTILYNPTSYFLDRLDPWFVLFSVILKFKNRSKFPAFVVMSPNELSWNESVDELSRLSWVSFPFLKQKCDFPTLGSDVMMHHWRREGVSSCSDSSSRFPPCDYVTYIRGDGVTASLSLSLHSYNSGQKKTKQNKTKKQRHEENETGWWRK